MTTTQTLTPRLPRPRRGSDFYSRNEAVKAAREAIWGDVPFSKRHCAQLQTIEGPGIRRAGLWVTADVNGRLVLIDFDNYGRVHSIEQVD